MPKSVHIGRKPPPELDTLRTAHAVLVAKLKDETEEWGVVRAVLNLTTDRSSTKFLKTSNRYLWGHMDQIYAIWSAAEDEHNSEEQELIKALRAETRVKSKDLLTLIIRRMTDYKGPSEKQLISRDAQALRYARRQNIKPSDFIDRLASNGAGLDKWARLDRAQRRPSSTPKQRPPASTTASLPDQTVIAAKAAPCDIETAAIPPARIRWRKEEPKLLADHAYATLSWVLEDGTLVLETIKLLGRRRPTKKMRRRFADLVRAIARENHLRDC